MTIPPRTTAFVLAMLLAGAAGAQRTPTAMPKNMPFDITPRVADSQCGGFVGHFGPLDYRSAHPLDKRVVEEYHFDMELRTFLSGQLSGRNRAGTSEVGGGFDYVLKAIPNHPTALLVMEQLGRKLKSENPQGLQLPLECYYVRAFKIAPDDPIVRAMYGTYLAHRGRGPEAVNNLDIADAALPDSGNMQHHIGLANVLLKRYDKAQLNALRIRRTGFALDTVERQLKDMGKWRDGMSLPAAETAPEAAAAASAPAAAEAASEPR